MILQPLHKPDVTAEDVFNPCELDSEGNCLVLFPKGTRITEQMLQAALAVGVQEVHGEQHRYNFYNAPCWLAAPIV